MADGVSIIQGNHGSKYPGNDPIGQGKLTLLSGFNYLRCLAACSTWSLEKEARN